MAVYDSPGPGRVLLAQSDGPLVAEPTWTRFDNITNCRCYGFDSNAGRQTELDTTDTGNATVFFNDQVNVLDDDDLVGLQVLLQLYDPVALAWRPRWRGHVDDINYDAVDIPGGLLSNVQMTCVGVFDYLGGTKFLPGIMGNPFPATITGTDVVFYEDGNVDDRCRALLDDAGLDPAMYVVFTGNIEVNEVLYDPDDVILTGLRDAADAEFPGVANVYEDRFGRVAFHGRFARFDPEGTAASASAGAWDFNSWDAATREDVTTGVAQVKEFSWNRPRSRILNSYLAWPRADENGVEFNRDLIPGMIKTDTGSIGTYGYHGDEAPDLLIKKLRYSPNTSGAGECELFAQFYVDNYSQIRRAIQSVVFRSAGPTDPRAAAVWELMTKCDVSDRVTLTIDEAGIAAEPYFIDGVTVECRVLNPGYDIVTVTPNLTPASYFGTDVFSPPP